MIKDWTDQDPILNTLTKKEQEDLQGATDKQIRSYNSLDHAAVEEMIVGYLIGNKKEKDEDKEDSKKEKTDTKAAEKIIDAGIKSSWFEDKELAEMFDCYLSHYKKVRCLLDVEEAPLVRINQGEGKNEAHMYKNKGWVCLGAIKAKKIRIDLLIERMVTRHLMKMEDEIYKKAVEERANPEIGPRKSWENMREKCVRDLIDPRGAAIKEYDFIDDGADTVSWLLDMKHHPEKYQGAKCGIRVFDDKTQGFRPGQLTTIVGAHGGFKTTTMLNIAYGLWEKGYNVLYASLEMEHRIVKTKLLCRATKKISYTKVYGGHITEPDKDTLKKVSELKEEMAKASPEDAKKIDEEIEKILSKFDTYNAEKFFREQQAKKKNRLKVLNAGQSSKLKLSQLERWLHEKANEFKPDVVILDYLDLLEPEIVNPDRLDVGFGDICKMSRKMGDMLGFSVITAAQMKRTAIERLRKYGLENPEKAAFGTDDVSGSSMIGADSDNMFVLWRKGGGTELTVFTVKSRYNAIDNIAGETLQVDHDTCSIGGDDKIETTEVIMNKKNYGDMTKGAANCAKPKYTAFPDEGDEDPLFNFNAPINLDDDVVTVGNAIAPTKQDHGIFDL